VLGVMIYDDTYTSMEELRCDGATPTLRPR